MAEVLFYHLENARLESVLPDLLEKSLEKGWRAVVLVGDEERVDALDAHLWTYRDEAFLPHAAGDPDNEIAAHQPIWMSARDVIPNNADVLFLVEGASFATEALDQFARCVTIFDGRDDAAVASARVFWKAVRSAGFDATYWRQSSTGKWEKQS